MGLFGGDASASVVVKSNALGVSATVGKEDLATCACCRALIFRVGNGWVHFDGLGHCIVHPSCLGKCPGPHGYAHPGAIKDGEAK